MAQTLPGIFSGCNTRIRNTIRAEDYPVKARLCGMAYDKRKALAALAAFQTSTGLKDFPWEKASGVGEGTLRKFRTGSARSMSDETYEKLAAGASDLLDRKIAPARLRPGAATDVELPIRSYVGAGDEVVEPVDGDGPIDYVTAPPELAEGEVLEVRGRSMLPAYEHGDLLFHRFMDPDPRQLIGKLVIAKLKDGRRFVKVLLAGTKRGRFTLASLNPSFAPMEDQAVAAVARIVWVKKRG